MQVTISKTTMTLGIVRDVARLFEVAGMARTERSIVNWCQPNAQGISRLNAYFDPNEYKYFITPQSVELAIQEELAKAAKAQPVSEPVGTNQKMHPTEDNSTPSPTATDSKRIQQLEAEVLDLKITNRAKDYFIDQLKQEREAFTEERQQFVDKLMTVTRKVGELESHTVAAKYGGYRSAE